MEEHERMRQSHVKFDDSDQFQIAALRAETVVEQDGRIDIPGVKKGDSVEVIVLIRYRPRVAASNARDDDPFDEFDPFADP